MRFLSEYAASVVVVSLLALLFESVVPGGTHKKYLSMVIGLLVMLVIVKPLTHLPHYDDTFSLPELNFSEERLPLPEVKPYVAEQFEKNLALSISESLHRSFGSTVSCRVFCEVNEEGQIMGIRLVQLVPYTQECAAYVAKEYAIEEACITP